MFKCTSCLKEFKQKSHLKTHIFAEHKGIRFDCSLCGKEFKRKGSLGRHLVGKIFDTLRQLFLKISNSFSNFQPQISSFH